MAPSLTVGALVAALPEVYQPIYGHPEFSARASRACIDRLAYIRQIHDLLARKLGRPVRVLDVGCAQGFFSLHLAEAGATVLGIDRLDANVRVCEALRNQYGLTTASFRTLDFEAYLPEIGPDQFDLVLGLSVFHHLCHAHGFAATRAMVAQLANRVLAGLFELALATEPLPWANSLPDDEYSLVADFAFVQVLEQVPTHLSAVPRPLVIASSRYWFLGGACGRIEATTMESHLFARGTHEQSRRYFRGEGLLIKQYSYVGARGEFNRSELAQEARFLEKPIPGFGRTPKLHAWAEEAREGWLVREEIPGRLLSELQSRGEKYSAESIARDVLRQLVALEAAGLFHNDVRVWNTLVLTDGRATLIDYGAISPVAIDCTSQEHPVYSFFAYLAEVSSGVIQAHSLLRFPYTTPARLQRHYGRWLEKIWAHPLEQWTYRLFLDTLSGGETDQKPPPGESAPDARQAYLERFVGLAEARLAQVSAVLDDADANRVAREKMLAERASEIVHLTSLVKQHEAESANRNGQILQLTELVGKHEAESASRNEQILQLTELVRKHEVESSTQLAELTGLLKSAQADAESRLEQVHSLTVLARRHETESADRASQIELLNKLAREYQEVIRVQTAQIDMLGEQSRQMEDRQRAQTRELHHLQTEASLAARLLGQVAALPVSAPARWFQLPSFPFAAPSAFPVTFTLEAANFGAHLVRITGWGFADAPHAAPVDAPFLLFAGPRALWVLRGVPVDRPDVAAAFPSETTLAARRRSGFVFEFHPSQLPTPTLRDLRIVCGQVAGEPVFSPPFSLP